MLDWDLLSSGYIYKPYVPLIVSSVIDIPSDLSNNTLKIIQGEDVSKILNISLIAAMSENRVIGKDNKLPWHIPEDLKYFKEKTKGKTVIMGRKTYESMGRLLPNRKNVIITQNKNYKEEQGGKIDAAIVVFNIEDAIKTCDPNEEIMIIGGANIYKQFLSIANKIYLTVVHTNIDGDTQFPLLDDQWKETQSQFNDGSPSFTFKTYSKTV